MALLQGPSMLVHLDPRRDGVVVPQHFRRQPQLVLQFGMNLVVPIRDLDVNEEGLSGTLSFNRSPCWCYLPWSAVYALVGEDGRGMVWPDDVPPEIAAAAQRSGADAPARPAAAKKPRKRARPRASTGAADDADTPSERAGAEADPQAGRADGGEPVAEPSEKAQRPAGPRLVPSASAADAAGAGSPPPEAPKTGRKLPPYLRVIK